MVRFLAAAAAALVLAACGGDDDDGGAQRPVLDAKGTIPVTASDFAAVSRTETCTILDETLGQQTFGLAVAAIGASDRPGLCAAAQQGQQRQNDKTLTIVLVSTNAFGPATIAPGAYALNPASDPAQFAFLTVTRNDATCGTAAEVEAASGSVTLSSVAGGRLQGTVQATLSDGGTVSGGFDAPACAIALSGDVCAGEIIPPGDACTP